MHDYNDGGWGPGRWIFVGLMMLAFSSVLVGLVVYIVRNVGQRGADSKPVTDAPDSAMRILDERFARGDIDIDEYTHRRDALRSR